MCVVLCVWGNSVCGIVYVWYSACVREGVMCVILGRSVACGIMDVDEKGDVVRGIVCVVCV